MEPVTLFELIAWVESRSTFGAIRFEPAVYDRFAAGKINKAGLEILARIVAVNKCSQGTAKMIYSTSWGAVQIMGFNLYADPKFDMPIAEYLDGQGPQTRAFRSFLVSAGLQDFTPAILAKSKEARLKFSTKYNGSIAYDLALRNALNHFGLEITENN